MTPLCRSLEKGGVSLWRAGVSACPECGTNFQKRGLNLEWPNWAIGNSVVSSVGVIRPSPVLGPSPSSGLICLKSGGEKRNSHVSFRQLRTNRVSALCRFVPEPDLCAVHRSRVCHHPVEAIFSRERVPAAPSGSILVEPCPRIGYRIL
jgi:hypothetical protein